MIQFKIMKTTFKNALAISKRALPKKDGKTFLVGKGKELFIFTRGVGLEVFDYVSLTEETEAFAIEIDPAPIDKWLDGGNRELVFEIKQNMKKKDNPYILYSVEKKKSEEVVASPTPDKSFLEVRQYPFQEFNNQAAIIKSWYEANNTFQNSDRIYSKYAKITDINFMVFDPLFFSAYFYHENFGIVDRYGHDGIAVPQEAIDTFVKTVKKPKSLQHFLTDKRFLIREEDTIFAMNYSADIKFPEPRTLEVIDNEKHSFFVDATEVKEALKGFPNAKVSKLRFNFNGTHLIIGTENPEFSDVEIPCTHSISCSTFTPAAIKSFFEGLEGNTEITFTRFNSKVSKNGYYWKYQDREKAKIVPGIKEAPGF
ncbi:hypothetical protein [Bacillus thuringiensis]|uniref:Uncharacterized protein n=1 Tax=Bacillus thuringiensis TaxID=1428 RepID=A0A9X6ZQB7_BACTU|nr:hypothetical protein [Bacillus thuringiensis]PFJ29374.1 hypothetical protein COJ15_31790 [Bacillus thuringiensis]